MSSRIQWSISLTLLCSIVILNGCSERYRESAPLPPPADLVFQLRKKNIRSAQLGEHMAIPGLMENRSPNSTAPSIPLELRFKSVDAKELVECVAKREKFKFVWVDNGKAVVFYRGATAQDLESTLAGLNSGDNTTRFNSAVRAGRIEDPQIIHALLDAANAGPEVSPNAIESLRRLGWPAVLLLAPEAMNLAVRDLANPDEFTRNSALYALAQSCGNKAFPIIERLLEQDQFGEALIALAIADKDRAFPIIERALEQKVNMRRYAVSALGQVGGEKSLSRLEKLLPLLEDDLRESKKTFDSTAYAEALHKNAIYAFQQIGGEKALTQIERYLSDRIDKVRWAALSALSNSGALGKNGKLTEESRARVWALIEESISKNNEGLECVIDALFRLGGDRAIAILNNALNDEKIETRVVSVLANISIDIASFEDQLKSQDVQIRRASVYVLGRCGGDKVIQFLRRALEDEDSLVRLNAIRSIQRPPQTPIDSSVLPILHEALADKDSRVRIRALNELILHGALSAETEKRNMAGLELSILEEAISDKNVSIRIIAFRALEHYRGEKATALLRSGLDDENLEIRMGVVRSLEYFVVKGEQSAAISLGKALQNKAPEVRENAVSAICRVKRELGRDATLALLKNALADQYPEVRRRAANALGDISGREARNALLVQLANERDEFTFLAIREELRLSWSMDGDVEKALRSIPSPPTKPNQSTPPAVKPTVPDLEGF